MRFVFTAPRFHTNQHHPVRALLDAGHEVAFLVLRRGRSETYEALEPTVLGSSASFELLRRLFAILPGVERDDTGGVPPPLRFLRELRRLKPDVVVARDTASPYCWLALLGARLVGVRPIAYVQAPRHRPVGWTQRLKRRIVLGALGADWFTPTLGDPERYEAPYRAPRYVPFVIEPQTAPEDRRWFDGGAVRLLAIGKFEPRKNHPMFLEVVHRLSRRHALSATIVGERSTDAHDRELAEVMRIRGRLGLEDTVAIETNLPFREVQEIYAAHDLFVLASRDEPAAVSPLEAMAHSLPVVSSDANGTSCYVRPGDNGFLFRSGDPDDLEARLDTILADRQRIVEMGRRSYELALTEHPPARYVEALVDMAAGNRR